MLNIGCHLSASKGYKHMGKEALSINANTFQYFSRNPRGSQAKQVNVADINELIAIMQANAFAPLLVHAPYTLNACSADEGLRGFAKRVMEEDLETLQLLPNNYYNFHPGSHVGQGIEEGIDFIAQMLNHILKPELKTTVLLETMSGKGSEIGRTFDEIRAVMDKTHRGETLGVCLDTCHVYSAGYDIVNNLDGVVAEFDKIIGLEKLKAIHLNDSMMEFSSFKDRHEKIGGGSIGLDAIVKIINHPKLRHLPFYLETPNEIDGYAEEIKLLRENFNS